MQFDLTHAAEVFTRTPRVLDAMLRGVSEPWVRNNDGPETFSPFDVVGHLIHGERADWMPRLHLILQHGESRAFEPFDRYAMYEASKGRSIVQLLDTFAELRAANVRGAAATGSHARATRTDGPAPGAGRRHTAQPAGDLVARVLNHIHQVAKCMEIQDDSEVGPWRPYLTILPQPASMKVDSGPLQPGDFALIPLQRAIAWFVSAGGGV